LISPKLPAKIFSASVFVISTAICASDMVELVKLVIRRIKDASPSENFVKMA
jgi:hypothetical protein